MRRFAGKCVALFMALLMLLTSMPLTSLAESMTSAPFGIDALVDGGDASDGANDAAADAAAAIKAVEDAIEDNENSGKYLVVFSATAPSSPVSTGATFSYSIGYNISPAVKYILSNGYEAQAYDTLEDVRLRVTAPDGIELLDEYSRKGNTYIYSLGDIRVGTAGSELSKAIRGRMTGNGQVPDGRVFDKLDITIEADVTIAGTTQKRTFTYDLTPDKSGNNSNVTSQADNDWVITKTGGTAEPAEND